MTDVIEINVTNLARRASIGNGLLALGLFVYKFGLSKHSFSWLDTRDVILPVVIVATREAIRSIPGVHSRGR